MRLPTLRPAPRKGGARPARPRGPARHALALVALLAAAALAQGLVERMAWTKQELQAEATAYAALRGATGEIPEDNELCTPCHRNFRKETLAATHLAVGVSCATCHGVSYEHMNDETAHTKPDIMYGRAEVAEFCLRCHEGHQDPAKVAAFLAEWKTRTRPNGRIILDQAMCTDCHGEHAMLRTPVMAGG